MKWLSAKTRIMPRLEPAARRSAFSVEWVNGCWITPCLAPKPGVQAQSVTAEQVAGWFNESSLQHEADWSARSRQDREMLREALNAGQGQPLVGWAIGNLGIVEAARPSLRGMACPPSSECVGCDAIDGFAASRLLLPNLWLQACERLGKKAEFWACIPSEECLAIFRTESDARALLSRPVLRGEHNPCPVCFEPFVLTRDGVAGIATFADMGDGMGLPKGGGR